MVVGLRGIDKESLALCPTQDGVSERYEELQLLLRIVPEEIWWLSWGFTIWILKKCVHLLTLLTHIIHLCETYFASWWIISTKWDSSKVSSNIFPVFCFCGCSFFFFKCWWGFCPLKLSIWQQKKGYTEIVPNVHLACRVLTVTNSRYWKKCIRTGQSCSVL